MTGYAAHTNRLDKKPSREEALALAAERKAARRLRTKRIRTTVAVIAAAAFIGPFGVIVGEYAQSSSNTTASTSAQTQTTSPAPVTTQQS